MVFTLQEYFTRRIWGDKWALCQSTTQTSCRGGWQRGTWWSTISFTVEYLNLPRVSPEDKSRVAMVGGTAPKNIRAAEVWHLQQEKSQFQSICILKPQWSRLSWRRGDRSEPLGKELHTFYSGLSIANTFEYCSKKKRFAKTVLLRVAQTNDIIYSVRKTVGLWQWFKADQTIGGPCKREVSAPTTSIQK